MLVKRRRSFSRAWPCPHYNHADKRSDIETFFFFFFHYWRAGFTYGWHDPPLQEAIPISLAESESEESQDEQENEVVVTPVAQKKQLPGTPMSKPPPLRRANAFAPVVAIPEWVPSDMKADNTGSQFQREHRIGVLMCQMAYSVFF